MVQLSVSRSVAVNTVGNLAGPLLALATQPLLALGLGVTGRGEFAAAIAPLMLVTAILTLGVPDALTYFVARRAKNVPRLALRGLIALALAGIAGFGLIAVIAPVLTGDNEALSALIVIAGLGVLPALLVAGLRGITAGRHDWRRIALYNILNSASRFLAILVLFLTATLTPLSATIAFAVTTFAGGIVFLLPRSRPKEADAAALTADSEPLPDDGRGSLISYGLRIWLGTLVGALMSRLDQVLMTPLTAAEQLGLYAVAVSVSEVALVFNTSIREVLFSVEAEAPSDRRVGLASRLSTYVTLVLSALIAVLAPWAFPWLFGPGFAAAVPVLWLLQLGIVLGNPGSTAGVALSARGRPELRSAALGIAVVVNVLLVVLLVPPFGAIGAAAATLGGMLVAGNLTILFLRLWFGVPMSLFYAFHPDDLRELLGMARSLLRRKGEG